MWYIEYYETARGKIPVYEFLETLPVKMRGKAARDIELLERLGPQIKMPHARYMEDGIFELRVRFGSDSSRIFYFFYAEQKIILTNGFIKKTTKTPAAELEKAKQYKQDYERRSSR